MTELDTSEDFLDLDDWLAGAARNTRLVTLYARNDLYAEIQELERERDTIREADDGSMAGTDTRELDAQIDALWKTLGASKREFRVSARNKDEMQTIIDAVREEFSDQLEKEAEKGRAKGMAAARRQGIKDPREINELVRRYAVNTEAAFVDYEAGARNIAASTQVQNAHGEWVNLTTEAVKKMYVTLGEAQMMLINDAISRTASEAPKVTVPKS